MCALFYGVQACAHVLYAYVLPVGVAKTIESANIRTLTYKCAPKKFAISAIFPGAHAHDVGGESDPLADHYLAQYFGG